MKNMHQLTVLQIFTEVPKFDHHATVKFLDIDALAYIMFLSVLQNVGNEFSHTFTFPVNMIKLFSEHLL